MTSPGRSRPSILLIDHHPLVRDALGAALSSLEVVDRIDRDESLPHALERLRSARDYDLIVLDLHLGDAEGVASLARLRETWPDLPVVIFSGDDAHETVQAAFEHGALGYVSKRASGAEIVTAVRQALTGRSYVSPRAARRLAARARTGADVDGTDAARAPRLTPRQLEVFEQLLRGMPIKVIAARLGMAEGTVRAHLYTIYRAFGARSRVQLILEARRLGLDGGGVSPRSGASGAGRPT